MVDSAGQKRKRTGSYSVLGSHGLQLGNAGGRSARSSHDALCTSFTVQEKAYAFDEQVSTKAGGTFLPTDPRS